MYVVATAIRVNDRDYEPGATVSSAELGIYVPDLIAQKAIAPAAEESAIEKEEPREPVL